MRRAEPRMTWWARFLRGMRPDRNPLRRTTDRVETAVVTGLLVVFLGGAPLAALAASHWAYTSALRVERAEQASWHAVPAVLLRSAPGEGTDPYGDADLADVPARWTAPDGTPRVGEVAVEPGATAGSTVTIWINAAGTPTGPPLGRDQVADRATIAGVLAVLAVALVTGLTGVLVHRELDRRRLAAWGAEWDAAGPRWTSHR